MSDRHVLTVGILRRYLENGIKDGILENETPIIIIENDSESAKEIREQYGRGYNGKYTYANHDQFEGLRLCNVGGIVYNTNEHERAVVLGFSHETRFKDIINNGPTEGNVLHYTLFDIKQAEPLTFDKAPELNINPEDISFSTEHK